MKFSTLALLVAAISTTALPASALAVYLDGRPSQPGPARLAGNSFGLPRAASIIGRRDVQRDLSLNADVVKAVKTLLDANRPTPGTKPDAAALDALDAKVVALLEADQAIRLRQIEIQLAGLRAVFNASVQTALALTDDQKTKLAALLTAGQEKKGCDPATLDAAIAIVLTDAQKTTLIALGGAKFTADKHP